MYQHKNSQTACYTCKLPKNSLILSDSVCRKPQNFSFIVSNVVVDIVRIRINPIRFIFFEAEVRTFEIRITAWRKHNLNR